MSLSVAQPYRLQISFAGQFNMHDSLEKRWSVNSNERGGGILQEKLGGGVRPASRLPYPIYERNLRFFLLYL